MTVRQSPVTETWRLGQITQEVLRILTDLVFDNGLLYEDCGTIKQADAIERCARNDSAIIVGIGTSYQAASCLLRVRYVKMANDPDLVQAQKGGSTFFCVNRFEGFAFFRYLER